MIRRRLSDLKFWITGIPPRDEFDVCMCGSYMEDHGIGSGHSPVSVGAYYTRPPAWKRVIQAILCKIGRHGPSVADHHPDFSIMRCERCSRPLTIDMETYDVF
jgi:hypothetical protein